jgi:hypothetical protein
MPKYSASRYAVGFEDVVDGSRIVGNRKFSTANNPYFTYVAKDGDSFSKLAAEFLNDDSLFWYVADHNPHVSFPDLIPVGTLLRIPLS